MPVATGCRACFPVDSAIAVVLSGALAGGDAGSVCGNEGLRNPKLEVVGNVGDGEDRGESEVEGERDDGEAADGEFGDGGGVERLLPSWSKSSF